LVCAKRLWQVIVVAEQLEAKLILNSWFVHEVCSMYQFVSYALQVRDIVKNPETAKVWYPYMLGWCGVHYRNISCIIEGSTWASPC
jgi:hypothetical protein